MEKVTGTTGLVTNALLVADRRGAPNAAVLFDATDSSSISFGDLNGATLNTTAFTIACWVRANDTLAAGAILSKRERHGPFEYSLDNHFSKRSLTLDNWIDNGGNTVYGIDPLNASAPIHPGQWTHLTFTGDGDALRVYRNGVLMAGSDLRTGENVFTNTDARFVVGNGGGWDKDYFFSGAVDEIRIYNRVLPVSAIQRLAKF